VPHIVPRDAERQLLTKIPGYRARRWPVERTHSWMNRFRRILVRWEKKVENYTGMLHLVCAFIAFKQAGPLGYALRAYTIYIRYDMLRST
jgi:putative transposase